MLTVTVSRIGTNTAVIALSGEMDITSVAIFRERLQELAGAEITTTALDLRNLEFLDSTGLRAIVEADQDLRLADRRLVIVRGRERVDRVFSVTGLSDRLEIVDDFGQLELEQR